MKKRKARASRPRLDRKRAAVLVALLLIGWAAGKVASETITLETLYPSAAGIYKLFITTAKTILARDGGNVGIGTTSPQSPAPNGKASGNLTANDVYLTSINQWMSGRNKIALNCVSRNLPTGMTPDAYCGFFGETCVSAAHYTAEPTQVLYCWYPNPWTTLTQARCCKIGP